MSDPLPSPNAPVGVTDRVPVVGRRRFLRIASAISASIGGILLGIPAAQAFLAPVFQRRANRGWTKVAQADLVDIDTPVKADFVEAANDAWIQTRSLHTVWLHTEDGEKFTAMSGTCTHLGCSVMFDKQRDAFICPCHQGVFNSKTGAVLGGPPPRGLDTLPVRVVDGGVQVMLKQFRTGIPERIET